MAKPTTPLVVWAHDDVILPGTGKENKIKPIDDLLSKGYDKGQKPACEEFNYILNISSTWINWVVNEKIPEVEEDYNKKIKDLESRVNEKISKVESEIVELRDDLNELRVYVNDQISTIRRDINTIREEVSELRKDVEEIRDNLQSQIDDMNPFLVPVGAVVPWPGSVAPQGWLECNGQAFSTSQNPRLYAVLGKNTVPDYRGLFLRGWAHGSSFNDPDSSRTIGSVQSDAIRNILGKVSTTVWGAGFAGSDFVNGAFSTDAAIGPGDGGTSGRDTFQVSFDASRVVPTAEENRPKNVAVMYIIKTDKSESQGTIGPSSIRVSPDNITNRVGNTTKITANVLPADLASQYPVNFRSENGAVASVDSSGNVTLTGPGETNVVAYISTGMSSLVKVTSYSVLTSLSISPVSPITVGTSASLQLNKGPRTATEPLEYTSSDNSVATVADNGAVSAQTPGTTTITVRGIYSGVSASTEVSVVAEVEVESVEDNRLGAMSTMAINTSSNDESSNYQVPTGCTLTGIRTLPGGTALSALHYKPIQKRVNGVWVTITG